MAGEPQLRVGEVYDGLLACVGLAARRGALLALSCLSEVLAGFGDDDVFKALLRLRGMESRSPSGLAEAF